MYGLKCVQKKNHQDRSKEIFFVNTFCRKISSILLNKILFFQMGKILYAYIQRIAHFLGPITQSDHFWREWGRSACRSLGKARKLFSRILYFAFFYIAWLRSPLLRSLTPWSKDVNFVAKYVALRCFPPTLPKKK